MRFVIFTHSLVSDWNHGNAHFLRGVATELISRGIDVRIYEPTDGWSRQNLISEHGSAPVLDFEQAYPLLRSTLYDLSSLDLDDALQDADVGLVHEWNDPDLVARIGRHRAHKGAYQLFFHDTHHRSVTAPPSMAAYDLRHYDGVLAYGAVIRAIYLERGLACNAWTWHEAADTRVFYPRRITGRDGDLVWIGNWGDDERAEELREFLIEPVRRLGLKACVYGVRYPPHALEELARAGIEYKGWLPNYRVPEVFARFRMTVHVPRRPYATALPGIPTIRPFEAMACGIPLISAPWQDCENLFRPGVDFLFARDGGEMAAQIGRVLSDPGDLAARGLETIQNRHTCAHRVDQLFALTLREAAA
ncbi:MAG: CgeB family protein [Bryobacteraceae bacterium]